MEGIPEIGGTAPRKRYRPSTPWACSICTFVNDEFNGECEMCGWQHHAAASSSSVHREKETDVIDLVLDTPAPGSSGVWTCSECSFINDDGVKECEVCRAPSGNVQRVACGRETVELELNDSEDAGTVVLDCCGCRLRWEEAVGGAKGMARELEDCANLDDGLRLFRCKLCEQPLAWRDVLRLLGREQLRTCEIGFHDLVRCEMENYYQLGGQRCTTCKDSPPTIANQIDSLSTLQLPQLKQLLKKRGLPCGGRKTALVATLQAALAGCQELCPHCGDTPRTNPPRVLGRGLTARLWKICVDACLSEAHMEVGPQGTAQQKKKGRQGKQNVGWAKGVGYGGRHWDASRTLAETARQQKELDTRLGSALLSFRDWLTSIRNYQSKSNGSLPFVIVATVLGSGIPFVLQELLQNDCMNDISDRYMPLYREVFGLLKALAAFTEFVPMVCGPLSLFQRGRDGEEEPESSSGHRSLVKLLGTLDSQCKVFFKNADGITNGAGDLGALPIALDAHHTYLELKAKEPAWESIRLNRSPQESDQGGMNSEELTQQVDAVVRSPESEYVSALEPLLFNSEAHLRDHHFLNRIGNGSGGELMRKHLKAVVREVSTLSTSLPISFESSIFLAVDESNMDLMRALIIPGQDTPYANGAFVFDIFLPPPYPEVPPMVQFLTTGGGQARMNPNLYNDGKVCLSLLGTWSGPSWTSKSTLLQVLVSIQSMIFVESPYFNEPGYEAGMGSEEGKRQSAEYNHVIRYYSVWHAIRDAITHPPWPFANVCREHFRRKKEIIKEQCDKWLSEARHLPWVKSFDTLVASLRPILDGL